MVVDVPLLLVAENLVGLGYLLELLLRPGGLVLQIDRKQVMRCTVVHNTNALKETRNTVDVALRKQHYAPPLLKDGTVKV